MNETAIATLHNGTKIRGRLTTDHAASSFGQPVFVDDENQAWDWISLATVETDEPLPRNVRSISKRSKALYGMPMKQTAIYLPEHMLDWLKSQEGTMSEVIRNIIQNAMDDEEKRRD